MALSANYPTFLRSKIRHEGNGITAQAGELSTLLTSGNRTSSVLNVLKSALSHVPLHYLGLQYFRHFSGAFLPPHKVH